MGPPNEQLIHEAVECNHAGVGVTTLERYRDHLVHFAQYLASVHASDCDDHRESVRRGPSPAIRQAACIALAHATSLSIPGAATESPTR